MATGTGDLFEGSPAVPEPHDERHDRKEPPLDAYMASALTGLDALAKKNVVLTCDMIAEVCRQHGIELYEPRKKSDPVHNAELADHRVYFMDRDRVSNSDVVFLFCDHPSFGAGQELEIASAATVPVVLIVTRSDGKVSRMVTGSTGLQHKVKKEEPEDVRAAINDLLVELVPQLRERRRRISSAPLPEIGQVVADLRRKCAMDREQLAERVGMKEEWVRQLETESVATMNPSLRQLARVASALGSSVELLLSPAGAGPRSEGILLFPALVEAALARKSSADAMLRAARTAARGGEKSKWSVADWNTILDAIDGAS